MSSTFAVSKITFGQQTIRIQTRMPDFCLKIISSSTTLECSQTSHPLLIELRTFNTVAGVCFFSPPIKLPDSLPDCIISTERQRERGIRQPVSKYQNRPAKTERGKAIRIRALTFFPRSARIFSRSLKLYDHDKLYAFSNVTKSASIRFRELSAGIENVSNAPTNTYLLLTPSNIAAAGYCSVSNEQRLREGGWAKKVG